MASALRESAPRADRRNLAPLARATPRNAGLAERKLWAILRSKRLRGHAFRRQQPIGGVIAGFVCPKARLIIETDSSPRTEDVTGAQREAALHKQGFRILRLWNTDILTNPDGVATAILAALESPLAARSPAGGEGPNGAKNG